jgi:hypothetical protein
MLQAEKEAVAARLNLAALVVRLYWDSIPKRGDSQSDRKGLCVLVAGSCTQVRPV